MADKTDPTAPDAAPKDPPEGDAPPKDPVPKDPPAEPFAVFPTREAFEERTGRAARAAIREQFGADPDEVKKRLERLEALEAEAEERKKQEMSAVERAQAEAKEARERAAILEREALEAKTRAELVSECARRGIRDAELAEMMAERARRKDGDEFELGAFLDGLLEEPRHRLALGVEDAEPKTKPANRGGAPDRDKDAPGDDGKSEEEVDVMSMTREQFEEHKRKRGISTY